MIIAGIVFLIGILVGLSYRYVVLLIVSAGLSFGMIAFWLMLRELQWFSVLVLIGYLFALQSGYLVGAYFGVGRQAPLPEDDQAS